MGALQNEPTAAPLDQAEEANYNLKHPNIGNSCADCVRVKWLSRPTWGKEGGGALKGSDYLDAGSQAESQD